MPLREEILTYRPGWFIAFDDVPADTRNAPQGIDVIEPVASYRATEMIGDVIA